MLAVLRNESLFAAVTAWALAQGVKMPIEYLRSRRWDWSLPLRAGGMPSSHTALVTAAAYGVGVTSGFASTAFALAVVVAMIVIYDATGIRREAGRHAEIINQMVRDLLQGHPLHGQELLEVLGHSRFEAAMGFVLGLAVGYVVLAVMRT